MRLHEEPDFFKDAVSLTAEYLRLPETYVEKDYWVPLASGTRPCLCGFKYMAPAQGHVQWAIQKSGLWRFAG